MLKTPQKETATRDNPTCLIKHLTKRHIKERGERAMGQKDEKSRQESLPESFQIQGKLPTENIKTKEITEKMLNFIVLDKVLDFVCLFVLRRLLAEESSLDSGIKPTKSALYKYLFSLMLQLLMFFYF